jgi:transposase
MFSYISTEDRIPASHPLRQVRRLADQALDRLNPTFCQLYPEGDRPSIPPEQLLLALLLQAIYGIRSERITNRPFGCIFFSNLLKFAHHTCIC